MDMLGIGSDAFAGPIEDTSDEQRAAGARAEGNLRDSSGTTDNTARDGQKHG